VLPDGETRSLGRGRAVYRRAEMGLRCVPGSGVVRLTAVVITALLLASCGYGRGARQESTRLGPRIVPIGQPAPKGGGVYKVGSAYSINGQTYTPREVSSYSRTGIASWYGELFHGRRTANGEIFDMEALTAAHPTLPIPSYVRVTNPLNGRWLVLRVNDRGPYADNREIDLSWASAALLDIANAGTGMVRVDYLGPAPLDGNDSYERQALARQPWAGSRVAFAQSPAKALRAEARSYSYYRMDQPPGSGLYR
jgi:rare lipoprotein A